ncbi:unnamed protein product, partial [marine sediment metagenome]
MTFLLEHAPALSIGIPLLFAFLVPLVGKVNGKVRNAFVVLGMLLTAAIVLPLAANVIAGSPQVYVMGAESPGLTLPGGMNVPVRIVLEIDALSAMMAGLAVTVSFLALVYSFCFMKGSGLGKFYSLFFVMLAGLLGLLFTGDMFTLFVFFEVLSISSVALVAFWHKRAGSVEAAFKYLVVSAVASLFLLFAVGLLYGNYGVLNIAALSGALRFS